MRNFSIRLILLLTLIVVGPTIQKIIIGFQQKGQVCAPISEVPQSSIEGDKDEIDGKIISIFIQNMKSFIQRFPFNIQASIQCYNITHHIFLPPPQKN